MKSSNYFMFKAALLSLFVCFNAFVQAQITLSEDFDYGNTSGNLTGNGGSGFAAAWTGGTSAYTSTGLSFGALSGTGGAMIVASGTNAYRQITTGFAATGPVSGSFLFKLTAVNPAVLMLGLGTSGSSNNQNHYIGLMPANDGQSGNPALGIRGTGISAMTGGTALTLNTTYMYAFSYSSGSTSAWIVTLAQYNNFFDGATLDQTAMNAASVGSGSTNVTGKVTISTNSANLTTMNYIYTYFFGGGSMVVDRIRLSGTAALSDLGASSYTFNGTTNTDWAMASNWASGIVPTSLSSGDQVVVAANCDMSSVTISFPSGASLTVNSTQTLTLNGSSSITIQSGATATNNGTITSTGTFTNNGTYKGSGTFSGSLFTNPVGGIVAPGNSAGCMTFSNGFTNSGTLQMEIGGITPCSQSDRITITGTATLGGTLDFSFINGYTGSGNQTVNIIDATALSGTFGTVQNLPGNWFMNYNAPTAGKVTLSYNAVLAVELIDFKGKYIPSSGGQGAGGNLLTWTTAKEQNNKGFQVERLNANGQDWDILGFVAAKGKPANYEFTDNTPLSMSYYHLRQIDNDGKEVVSKVISVIPKGSKGFKIYPTIVSNGFLNIETDTKSGNTEGSVFAIYNLLGQQLIKGSVTQQIDISILPKGNYVIKIGTEQAKFMRL